VGINFVAIDIGLETFPPLFFTALRFAVAGYRPCSSSAAQVALRWVIAVGMVMGALQFDCCSSDPRRDASRADLAVVQSQVLFTAVFSAVLLRERPTAAS